MEILQSVVLPISIVAIIFGACFGILFLFLRSWHKQRMLMIEKGTIEKVKGLPDPQKNVRICLMILGAALGATIGLAFPHHLLGLAIFSITIGFTAIGYLVYYYIFVWKAGKKKEE